MEFWCTCNWTNKYTWTWVQQFGRGKCRRVEQSLRRVMLIVRTCQLQIQDNLLTDMWHSDLEHEHFVQSRLCTFNYSCSFSASMFTEVWCSTAKLNVGTTLKMDFRSKVEYIYIHLYFIATNNLIMPLWNIQTTELSPIAQ